jgi:hypothetical protein
LPKGIRSGSHKLCNLLFINIKNSIIYHQQIFYFCGDDKINDRLREESARFGHEDHCGGCSRAQQQAI